jgi:L-2-hydroxyglutarate oxidase
MTQKFDLVIIGGGILGVSIAYFLSFLNKSKRRIAVIEQANSVGFHTSSRNTGKVHAPYLYDPQKKRLFARASFYGFDMWEEYAKLKELPFKKDGVMEVSLDDNGTRILEKYLKWGLQNGLEEGKDIEIIDKEYTKKIEPNLRCESALHVHRDGSTDYLAFTKSLMKDSRNNGIEFLLNTKANDITRENDQWKITIDDERYIFADFFINAAGGCAMDIAHNVGIAKDITDVHFKGEYWKAPAQYRNLTKTSIYSVPEFSDYPFLDPHWIIRVDGSCEIGPNAVPVFSPYGYDLVENVKEFVPKILEMLDSGAKKIIFDKQFQELALNEIRSSISKSAMIDRVKRFLPVIDADKFVERGTAGIRSSAINDKGKFVPDVMIKYNDDCTSIHILNYNSPGATGALPFAAYIVDQIKSKGILKNYNDDAQCGIWKFSKIIDYMIK